MLHGSPNYTNPAYNPLRTTNNRTQKMSGFALSMRMRITNRIPPRTSMNKYYPRWQRGGQGFDPPRLHPLRTDNHIQPTHIRHTKSAWTQPHAGWPRSSPTRRSRESGIPRVPEASSNGLLHVQRDSILTCPERSHSQKGGPP
jgi:hypothetical protein